MPHAKDDRTLFVRGISFDTEAEALEAVFSEIGPVKQCFLIKDKDALKHRGFGFVQYAVEEDAAMAADQLNGTMVDGRKLQSHVNKSKFFLIHSRYVSATYTKCPSLIKTRAFSLGTVDGR
eukprot:gene4941-34712_t